MSQIQQLQQSKSDIIILTLKCKRDVALGLKRLALEKDVMLQELTLKALTEFIERNPISRDTDTHNTANPAANSARIRDKEAVNISKPSEMQKVQAGNTDADVKAISKISKERIGQQNEIDYEDREEEELEEFHHEWHRQSIIIQKVVQLERHLHRPSDPWDLYASHKFTDEEIDWLEGENILNWLSDGPIFSTSDGQLVIDGGNESLCDIVRLCKSPQGQSAKPQIARAPAETIPKMVMA